ncbi:MAG: hypothetical protein J6B12_00525 [Clostridia bacterium]|nr:hypothetical protein [Clostridia bacterium]
MKKKLFALILLCLLAVLAVACGKPNTPDDCKHKRITDTQYDPDCSLEGYIQHVCLDCGHTYKSDFVEPTGHKLVPTVTAPTCTEEGFTTYACSVCNYSYEAGYTEPTGHTLTSRITPQTCTEEGYTTYSCPCGYSYRTKLVIPNGHNLTKTTVAPSCTADGYDLYACNVCDYQYKTGFTAMAHDLTKKTVAPTCVNEGYTVFSCNDCDYSYKTNYTASTGHTYTKKIIAPTFHSSGYTISSCECGFSYISDYVWYSNIFSGIAGNEKKVFSKGVDLSYHNGAVDFEALADDGMDFVILRLGYDGNEDTKFEEYYKAARKAGLDIGAYIYTYATNADDLVTYTTTLLKHLEGKTFEYPIYLDIEDTAQKSLSKTTLMEMCTAYCNLLVQNRYYPGIYSYLSFIEEKLDTEQLSARFEVWMAHYPSSMLFYGENYYADEYNMWQYTETGSVDGIVGDADINICYNDYPSIIEKYGYNGYDQ